MVAPRYRGIASAEIPGVTDPGGATIIAAEGQPVRFLLISGAPIDEPIAWRGPIVMNTQEELRVAFEERERGTFIKHRKIAR